MTRALGRFLLYVSAACLLYYLMTREILPALGY